MIHNLVCIFEWLVPWHLYHETMSKTHLTNLLLWFAINIEINDADGVLDYFEDNYVGRFRINAPRGIPTFPIDFWNKFRHTDDELPRTNNAVEEWHRGFQAHVSACHPVFWNVSWSITIGGNLSEWEFYKMKVTTNLLHKEEDTLIATSVYSELSMTSQIVKELII